MLSLTALCEIISLQPPLTARVLTCDAEIDYGPLSASMHKLSQRAQWDAGLLELKTLLGPDPEGIKILTCMLRCACAAHDSYLSQGIPEEVFARTMGCFPRFAAEHAASYGALAFDRDWWTARQISLSLFRLGELEYERTQLDGANAISLHIPSDARLTPEGLRASQQEAKSFFARFYPAWAEGIWYCHSWLLDPALAAVLPPTSHILHFQASFRVVRMDYGAPDFMEWVFKNPRLALEDLPEHTTLQRNLKAYLLRGGAIGEGLGYLVDNPFLP